jgi:UDP-2,4-diacetamido-2,4,6-trideoxy-beta-L-altropyranose hydrolase
LDSNSVKYVYFVTDANSAIGTGHLQRCRLLAKEISLYGVVCSFILRKSSQEIEKDLEREFRIYKLPRRSDIILKTLVELKSNLPGESMLIVDSDDDELYNDSFQEQVLKTRWKLMYITIKDQHEYKCHILLNPNIIAADMNYKTKKWTKKLLGPEYFIFRDEFRKYKHPTSKEHGPPYHLFLAFGGTDPSNLTIRAIDFIKLISGYFSKINVIIGPYHQSPGVVRNSIQSLDSDKWTLHPGTSEISKIMDESNLGIISGGLTFWELTLLNIPSMIIAASEREKAMTDYYHMKKYAFKLADCDNLPSEEILSQKVKYVLDSGIENEIKTRQLSRLIDPNGITKVADSIMKTLSN